MKNKVLKHACTLLLALLPAFSLTAMDIGLLLDQSISIDQTKQFQYSGTLIPWFSTPIGIDSDLYISAGFTLKNEADQLQFIPELLRTELTLRMEENGEIHIGRIPYSDPLGFVVSGLLDGVRYVRDMDNGSVIGAGMWYTGFLYKKNAAITITFDELANFNSPVDYEQFLDTYFAPRRLVVAVDWEHPAFKELVRLNLAFAGQFDLSGSNYHSQYLIAKAAIPVNDFIFELGGSLEFVENNKFQIALAGEAGVGWFLPTQIYDRLSFLGRFSTGGTNDGTFVPFTPVTTESHGSILSEKLSGISMLRLDYTARLHQSFSINLQSSYFILSDLSYNNDSFGGKPDGFFWGNEFYGLLIWSPISDLQIKAGGGVFLPSMGNAYKDADTRWKIDLNVLLSLY